MRQKHRRLARVADDLAQPALALHARVGRSPRRRLRVHEHDDTELFGFRPERIELAIRELLAFAAAADGRAAESELLDGILELLGRQFGILQRDGRDADEAVRVRGAPLRDFLVLEPY